MEIEKIIGGIFAFVGLSFLFYYEWFVIKSLEEFSMFLVGFTNASIIASAIMLLNAKKLKGGNKNGNN